MIVLDIDIDIIKAVRAMCKKVKLNQLFYFIVWETF
jgi:hypothetical protein